MNLNQLLDAVKAKVVSIYSGESTAVIKRRYQPTNDLDKLAALNIDITPGKATFDLVTRSEAEREQLVAIVFRQKLPADVNAELETGNTWIDSEVNLVGLAVEHFTSGEFDSEARAVGVSLTNVDLTLYDPKALKEQKLFSSMILLTFLSF